MTITVAQATAQLASATTPEALRALISQIDVSAPGSRTLLFSGQMPGGGSSQAAAVEVARLDPEVRWIGNTEAARFLDISDGANDILRAKIAAVFQSDPNLPGTAAHQFLNGTYDPASGQRTLGLWDDVSSRFAATAVGDVRVIASGADSTRVFALTELPALLNTPGVTSVEGIPVELLRKVAANRGAEGLQDAFKRIKLASQLHVAVSGLRVTQLPGVPDPIIAIGDFRNSRVLDTQAYLLEHPAAHTRYDEFWRQLSAAEKAEYAGLARTLTHTSEGTTSVTGGKVLNKLGVLGVLMSFSLAASAASQAATAGDSQGALDIMGDWSADFLGSTVGELGGAAVGSVALSLLAAGGVAASAPLTGAVVIGAALAGGFAGADAGKELYALAKDRDDNGRMDLVDKLRNVFFGADSTITTPLPADLNGERYTIDASLTREQVVAHAKTDIAWRYALRELNPFVVTDVSYERHNMDGSLDLYDERTSQGTMSEQYLQDRADMLVWKARFDAARRPYNRDLFTEAFEGNWDFVDLTQRLPGGAALTLAIDGRGRSASDHQVVFGTNANDAIDGAGADDRLFGGGGNDSLSGFAGADYLEGGAGHDILFGGAGSDTLIGGSGDDALLSGSGKAVLDGGKGDDTYFFSNQDLAERSVRLIKDSDGLGSLALAVGAATASNGLPQSINRFTLSGWQPIPPVGDGHLQRWSNDTGFTLTAISTNRWTLAGGALPQEATLALEAGNTLSLRFGKGGAAIRIQDWAPGRLGIELMGWTPPSSNPADAKAAELRDLTLLQIAAGVDLYSVVGSGDAAALKTKLTAAPSRNGTAERLTPAQADALLGRYDIVAQYGNDGAGFSATVFRRKAVTDPVTGVPLPGGINAAPYVLAFRGNDLEPDRVGGVAKDGGLAALREINRYGFAWAQLDAMERFWAGLQQGKLLNRAGQWINVSGASGAADGGLKVIGSGVGAHLAAAFTLLHEDKVEQGIGLDGPGIGGLSNGAGGSTPITPFSKTVRQAKQSGYAVQSNDGARLRHHLASNDSSFTKRGTAC